MKFKNHLKDKLKFIVIFLISLLLTVLLLIAFRCAYQAVILVAFIMVLNFILIFFIDYFTKKSFYDNLVNNLRQLDKKYLITELMTKPNFYEGQIFYDSLYEIDKFMNEEIKKYDAGLKDFKEYIEMWVHEVKLPLSSINLILHNNKNLNNKKIVRQLNQLNDNVEQVLYYTRSENAQKDYLFKEMNLKNIISNIAVYYKDLLLEKNIRLITQNINVVLLSDSKWLEFIVKQIVNNSIKYTNRNANSFIKISASETKRRVILTIFDNGIGISKKDLKKVFNKTFTGQNGRKIATSTGMGLYIVKNLCDKLGHTIEITSKENEYTKVDIVFYKNDYFDVLK